MGSAVVAAAAFLLLSMGGAVVAAPVTVPVLVVLARRSTSRALRRAASSVVALTAGEVAWAAVYAGVGEAEPWIWLVPLLVIAATLSAVGWGRPGVPGTD